MSWSQKVPFKYWSGRISEIHEAFNASKPRGISSWWIDRRNPVQWETFWIALSALVLTLVFGLLQSITGILQVDVAYHPPA